MITILSKLIEFIYNIIKRLVNKMKYYFSTLEGKKDSIIIGKEEYKISSTSITCWYIRNKYELGMLILITCGLILVPTQTVLYFGGISIIKDKKIDNDELK